jgi:hypothetical protein
MAQLGSRAESEGPLSWLSERGWLSGLGSRNFQIKRYTYGEFALRFLTIANLGGCLNEHQALRSAN